MPCSSMSKPASWNGSYDLTRQQQEARPPPSDFRRRRCLKNVFLHSIQIIRHFQCGMLLNFKASFLKWIIGSCWLWHAGRIGVVEYWIVVIMCCHHARGDSARAVQKVAQLGSDHLDRFLTIIKDFRISSGMTSKCLVRILNGGTLHRQKILHGEKVRRRLFLPTTTALGRRSSSFPADGALLRSRRTRWGATRDIRHDFRWTCCSSERIVWQKNEMGTYSCHAFSSFREEKSDRRVNDNLQGWIQ